MGLAVRSLDAAMVGWETLKVRKVLFKVSYYRKKIWMEYMIYVWAMGNGQWAMGNGQWAMAVFLYV
jgi:hypothetical protein